MAMSVIGTAKMVLEIYSLNDFQTELVLRVVVIVHGDEPDKQSQCKRAWTERLSREFSAALFLAEKLLVWKQES